ncbi:DUF1488 family protein [Stappia sp. F7233]|uniref:DUF1488 family protein n=1 Tax=Stappia albiluteola TaxID=2758565 RepID=A0A839ADI0_9HYPH|nr:DUF1488 family protein [Stappia albiluteola]MBA5777088.1 DUF1488 family protein [Stappia albiluteola]
MALTFPNPSRRFDETRRGVHFFGHDGEADVQFFVEASALLDAKASVATETKCLNAFDAALGIIHDVAAEAHSNCHRTIYVLTANDFR